MNASERQSRSAHHACGAPGAWIVAFCLSLCMSVASVAAAQAGRDESRAAQCAPRLAAAQLAEAGEAVAVAAGAELERAQAIPAADAVVEKTGPAQAAALLAAAAGDAPTAPAPAVAKPGQTEPQTPQVAPGIEAFEGGYLLPVGGGLLVSVAERHEPREQVGRMRSDRAELVITLRTKRRFGCSNYALRGEKRLSGHTVVLDVDRVEAYTVCVPPIGQAVSDYEFEFEEGSYDVDIRAEGYTDRYRLTVSEEDVVFTALETSFSNFRPTSSDGSVVPTSVTVHRAFSRIIVAHCGYGGSAEFMPTVHPECDELFAKLAEFAEPLDADKSLEDDPSWRAWWMKSARRSAGRETRVYRLAAPQTKDRGERSAYYQAKMEELHDIVAPLLHGEGEQGSKGGAGAVGASDYTIRVVTWLGDEFCC